MSTLDTARMAFKVVCSLVFSLGMLASLPGTAVAQGLFGFARFCDDNTYDNTLSPPGVPSAQTTGLFTDLRRGNGINADYDSCVLNITGSTGSAGDMWITLLDSPGDPSPPPTFDCVLIRAIVTIQKFNNRKAVGFVTNYDPGTGTGLFLGLYDNGNSDALALSTFDANTGKLTATVANLFLGSMIRENADYILWEEICNDGTDFLAQGHVAGDSGVEPFSFSGSLPAVISPIGQIGIAGYAKSAFVDSSVRVFDWQPLP